MTTFPSDDEWAEIDRRARTAYLVFVMARRCVLFAAAAFLVFVLTWYLARHAGERRYDAWAETCSGHLRKHTNGE